MYPYIVAVVAVTGLWSLVGYMSSRAEQTEYSVVQSDTEYEIRVYPEHIVAQTVVTGSHTSALNQGFRILAGYIFGDNTTKERIAMTAPVVENANSESIAMTAPVLASIEGDSRTIAFGMPKKYTLETLPTPNDSRIAIVTVPEKRMAALRFSWFRGEERIQEKKLELITALQRDGLTPVGEPYYAGYNAPWTPPWMTRNEVMIEVE